MDLECICKTPGNVRLELCFRECSFHEIFSRNIGFIRPVNMPKADPSESQAWDLIPARPSLSSVKNAAADCRACDLWKRGTQTVFGEGARKATVMFIGEQPGNEEDLTGKPFVGPAGRLF